MSKGLKKETQADDSRSIGFERESKEFDHENKLLNEWSREEEEFLCKLYS